MRLLLVIPLIIALAPAQAAPASENAHYYADCFAAASAAKTYDRDGGYLRFACYGDAAKAFFDALGRRDPADAYEEKKDGVITRFTQKPKENTIGLDRCSDGPQPVCLLIFPAGPFLDK